jgi:predicted Na+-dependent transporter
MAQTGLIGTLMDGVNRWLERWIMVILPLVLVLGLELESRLGGYTKYVQALFMYLTFVSSLNVSKEQFRELARNPKALLLIFGLIHIVLPLLSYGLTFHLYNGSPELKLGALLAMIMPIGVTSIVWVNLARGNVGIAVSMVALDTLVSPLLVPFTLWLFVGATARMDTLQLIAGVIKLVVVPCVLGMLFGAWLRKRKKAATARAALALSSKLTLYAIILLNAAGMAASLRELSGGALQLLLTVGGLMVCGYAVVWLALFALRLLEGTEIAFTYTGGVRNYTAGIVIAQLYFSPQTAIPVMFAILLQHPIALLVHTLFVRRRRSRTWGVPKSQGAADG